MREAVGVDAVPEMLAEARGRPRASRTRPSCRPTRPRPPFEAASFDLACTLRTLHHVGRPELAIAELARVTRPGGHLLVADHVASVDPLEAGAHNRLERLRDPSHHRTLSDADFRGHFDANGLVLERFETERDEFELDRYLELASCEGERRDAVIAEVERLLAAGRRAGIELRRSKEGYALTLTVAWYLLHRGAPDPTDL